MGKGAGGEDEPDDPPVHSKGDEYRQSVRKEDRLGAGYLERQAI